MSSLTMSSLGHADFGYALLRDIDPGLGMLESIGLSLEDRTIPGSGQKSMNTGIITIENYGSSVPSRVSHITFAHEVGHNFGSPHDSGLECTPGENKRFRSTNNGNFIMYSRATSGLKSNNKLFSDCSKSNISAVLEVKSSCFIQSDAPICGNGIVDKPNEECDCGFADDCAAHPQSHSSLGL